MARPAGAAAMLVSVYVTAPSMAEAERVARHVLGLRLAACANAFPVRSWFWWEGAVDQAEEVALILKARAEHVPRLAAEVKAVHSYSVPCVVAWPIQGGEPAYLQWVAGETAPGPAPTR